MTNLSPLIDAFGRVHTSLRVSVTDRCNIRCSYCMPATNVRFRPRHELLTFEEITQFVRAVSKIGVSKIRITGGEPLVRKDLPELVRTLVDLPDVDEVALTTNGMLLDHWAEPLKRAGLSRLNISLDTLREERFQTITRRPGLDAVLRGIDAARQAGFASIRLNALVMRDLTEDEIVSLVEYAYERGMEMRFIEFMPLDADNQWDLAQVVTGAEIRRRIEQKWGSLQAVERDDPSQPACDFTFDHGRGRVGFINPVSEPFCGDCNRIRLTAEGQVRNCLFSTIEWDARRILRGSATSDHAASTEGSPAHDHAQTDRHASDDIEESLRALVRDCVSAKKPGHGIDEPGFLKPQRAMYQIGG